jgi:tetratricopeptide (TPR) repeat protein
MREMILSFDAAKEAGRYDRYAEERKRAIAMREDRKTARTNNTNVVAENPVTNRLLEIQKTVEAKNYVQAETDLKSLLQANPSEARVYYNLGRVASLAAAGATDAEGQAKKLLEAKVAYENVIRLSQSQQVDPTLRSLSYVAMAKIFEFFDDKNMAIALYDAAIKLNVQDSSFKEAMGAKQRLMKTP